MSVTLLLVLGGAVCTASAEAAACEPLDVGPPGCVTVQAWATVADYETLTIYRLPARADYMDEVGEQWLARFTPYCEWNVEGTVIVDNSLCVRALSVCRLRGSQSESAMWMVLTPYFVGGAPRREGPICFANSSSVAIGPQIQALVEEAIGDDPPQVSLQPQDAIVNLPLIAYTEARDEIMINVDDPIAGIAEAKPEYLWKFANGAAAHGPGLAYDGTSPTENPGYYVSYTYHELGTPTVSLTVTWRVTFTIPGNDPIPLDDVVREATATTTVRAAGSELVGG